MLICASVNRGSEARKADFSQHLAVLRSFLHARACLIDSDYESGGRGFESCPVRHKISSKIKDLIPAVAYSQALNFHPLWEKFLICWALPSRPARGANVAAHSGNITNNNAGCDRRRGSQPARFLSVPWARAPLPACEACCVRDACWPRLSQFGAWQRPRAGNKSQGEPLDLDAPVAKWMLMRSSDLALGTESRRG
jgi:hypothetical protein